MPKNNSDRKRQKILAATQTGETLFHVACREGHVHCLTYLLEQLITQNNNNIEAYFGQLTEMKTSLQHGAATPLHYATAFGHHSCAEILLLLPASRFLPTQDTDIASRRQAMYRFIAATDNEGATALHKAAFGGHTHCLRRLIELLPSDELYASNGVTAVADNSNTNDSSNRQEDSWLQTILFAQDNSGSTALHKAAWSGSAACCSVLLSAAAASVSTSSRVSVCQRYTEITDKEGGTALFNAAYKQNADCISVLLQADSDDADNASGVSSNAADILVSDVHGASVLHTLAWSVSSSTTNSISPAQSAQSKRNQAAKTKTDTDGLQISTTSNSEPPPGDSAWSQLLDCCEIILLHARKLQAVDQSSAKTRASPIQSLLDRQDDQQRTALIIALRIVSVKGNAASGGPTAVTYAAVEFAKRLAEWGASIPGEVDNSKQSTITEEVEHHIQKAAEAQGIDTNLLKWIIEYKSTHSRVSDVVAPGSGSVIISDSGRDKGNERQKEAVSVAQLQQQQKKAKQDEEMLQKQQAIWKAAVQIFNGGGSNGAPKKALAYLKENVGVLGLPAATGSTTASTTDDRLLAMLLYQYHEDLVREKVGEYLGSAEGSAVREAYISFFSFHMQHFDVALRYFLSRFRLPGEAQKIDRLMEKFAVQYFSHHRPEDTSPSVVFANSDSVYLLAFATIMLNTDAHNPQVKKKMSKAEFLKNCDTVDAGLPLPTLFMEDLYDRIVNDAILLDATDYVCTDCLTL